HLVRPRRKHPWINGRSRITTAATARGRDPQPGLVTQCLPLRAWCSDGVAKLPGIRTFTQNCRYTKCGLALNAQSCGGYAQLHRNVFSGEHLTPTINSTNGKCSGIFVLRQQRWV